MAKVKPSFDRFVFDKFIPSVTLNTLGIQVLRVAIAQTIHKIRPAEKLDRVKDYLDVLEEEGVVVIPNFLPKEKFQEVYSDYKNRFSDEKYPKVFQKIGSTEREAIACHVQESSSIRDNFLYNEFLSNLIYGATKKHIYPIPSAILERLTRNLEVDQLDIMTLLHSDHYYPVFKAWFYLEDVKSNGAPFTYVKKSHKVSWPRLVYEYKLSNATARRMRDKSQQESGSQALSGKSFANQTTQPVAVDNKITTTDKFYEISLIEAIPTTKENICSVCCQANTLVLANTYGFHARGHLDIGQSRNAIHFSFR